MRTRMRIYTAAGIAVYIALVVTVARIAQQMPDDRLTAGLEGFVAGAILSWFAARDWMHKTGQIRRKWRTK